MSYYISIIIPVYNVEHYIKVCLQSVATQTMTRGIECILVDDCGTDRSMQVVEDFVVNYQGNISFSIIHHKWNRGLSAARNTGITAATGEYVYFLDSDDSLASNCLEAFFQIVKQHPGIDLVQGLINQDSPYMNQFFKKNLPSYTKNRAYIKRMLLNYDELPVCAANKMVRRQLIIDNELFFKEGIIHEDNHWSFFLAKHVCSLAVYKEQCYFYTVNDSSITKTLNKEKEILSYQTMISDFCNNVDDYQRGAQKICIYLLWENLIKEKYYHSIGERDSLFRKFSAICNPIECFFLKQWYKNPIGSQKHRRLGNILQHLFKL